MAEEPERIDICGRYKEVPVTENGCLVLTGERDWLIRGPQGPLAEIRVALGTMCEALSPNLLLLHFGNAIGFFKLPHLGTIEVVSGKWTQDHFDRMLADVMAVMSTLPFAAGTGGSLPYDRSVVTHPDILYHAFLYLRYILSATTPRQEQLLPALQLVFIEPHSRFERLQNSTPLDQVRHVTASTLVQMLHTPEKMIRVNNQTGKRLPLTRALQGYLPASMVQSEVRHTVDTPENQFVRAFLQFSMGVVERMEVAAAESTSSLFVARIRHDCETMRRALAPVVQHRLWHEVGSMVHLLASSTVLQRRRGYRDVFRHFSKLRLGSRIPLSTQQLYDLVEAKDIALLYELWSFFTIARSIEGILGPPSLAKTIQVSALQSSLPHDAEIYWKDGARLFYNPRFSRSAKGNRRSYSVPLRPDIALEIPLGRHAGLHLFDAKFRLDPMKFVQSENEDSAEIEDAEERQGKFKQADLYKMHTYRDAIPDARTVWILYPGTEFQMFSSDAVVYAATDTLPPNIEGVGAIPLQPAEAGTAHLNRVLWTLLSGVSTA